MKAENITNGTVVHITPKYRNRYNILSVSVYDGPMSLEEYQEGTGPVNFVCVVEQRVEAKVTRVLPPFVQVEFTAPVRLYDGRVRRANLETQTVKGWVYESNIELR